jgi:hypothetical protein
VKDLKSDQSRMVVIAARGATGDVASAAMAAIAGYPPQSSMVLKRIAGIRIPLEQQYAPTEITGLSQQGIIPIIDPALIVGTSLHFAEGCLFTSKSELLYIDIVRVLDDIEFSLKAGLIGMVGDARITRPGLTSVKIRIEGILGRYLRDAVIDAFAVDIPVLTILTIPDALWTETDRQIVSEARGSRIVNVTVTVKYGPAVHRLIVSLKPTFA